MFCSVSAFGICVILCDPVWITYLSPGFPLWEVFTSPGETSIYVKIQLSLDGCTLSKHGFKASPAGHFSKSFSPLYLPFPTPLPSKWPLHRPEKSAPEHPFSSAMGAKEPQSPLKFWTRTSKIHLGFRSQKKIIRKLENENWTCRLLWVIHKYAIREKVFMFAKRWYMENESVKIFLSK